MAPDRKLVAVSPPAALERRPRLFAAFEAAHPVVFVARPDDQFAGADAALLFAAEGAAEPGTPALPRLVLGAAAGSRTDGRVELAEGPELDAVLRGRRLADGGAAGPGVEPASGEAVLASCGRAALWTVDDGQGLHRAALAPDELLVGEVLRDRFRPGRWLALLPLEQFLREVTVELAPAPPPLRAAVMVDDPNLHWPSYGPLDFRALARHATLHGYHVSVAMIPLDARLVHPAAGRLFRERPDILSLIMHGNDHTRLELYRDMPADARRALVAQALRRADALERRHGIHVDRVMSAPHGLASEDAIATMYSLGVEALPADWSFPWAPVDRPPPEWPLAGWQPAQLHAGGFPVLSRYILAETPDDLVLRAYLRQPLIVYGHLRVGLDLLATFARTINGLGDVAWMSLEAIARSNVAVRQEGSTVRIVAFSSRFRLELPEGSRGLVVELPPAYGVDPAQPPRVTYRDAEGRPAREVTLAADGGRLLSKPFAVSPGSVELAVLPAQRLDPYAVPAPRRTPWPVLRRVLTEGRDRIVPFLSEEI